MNNKQSDISDERRSKQTPDQAFSANFQNIRTCHCHSGEQGLGVCHLPPFCSSAMNSPLGGQ